MKIYKNVGTATKVPPCFDLVQNGPFIEHGWSDFYETFESGFLTSKRYITTLKSIKYHVE